jgi:hypothetical protein
MTELLAQRVGVPMIAAAADFLAGHQTITPLHIGALKHAD